MVKIMTSTENQINLILCLGQNGLVFNGENGSNWPGHNMRVKPNLQVKKKSLNGFELLSSLMFNGNIEH